MLIDRLPGSEVEKPLLYAAVTNDGRVVWTMGEVQIQEPDDDCLEWYQVWRGSHSSVIAQACCWYSSEGIFKMQFNGLSVEDSIRTIHKCAQLVGNETSL